MYTTYRTNIWFCFQSTMQMLLQFNYKIFLVALHTYSIMKQDVDTILRKMHCYFPFMACLDFQGSVVENLPGLGGWASGLDRTVHSLLIVIFSTKLEYLVCMWESYIDTYRLVKQWDSGSENIFFKFLNRTWKFKTGWHVAASSLKQSCL